jgi:hypothetical protein
MTPEEIGRWLYAIAKHLKVYAVNPRLASLFAMRRSAHDGELLLRLRGLGRVSRAKLQALALDAGVAPQELNSAIGRLETTNLVSGRRTNDGQLQELDERIFTEQRVRLPLPTEEQQLPAPPEPTVTNSNAKQLTVTDDQNTNTTDGAQRPPGEQDSDIQPSSGSKPDDQREAAF